MVNAFRVLNIVDAVTARSLPPNANVYVQYPWSLLDVWEIACRTAGVPGSLLRRQGLSCQREEEFWVSEATGYRVLWCPSDRSVPNLLHHLMTGGITGRIVTTERADAVAGRLKAHRL
jgi:hypothetical protein